MPKILKHNTSTKEEKSRSEKERDSRATIKKLLKNCKIQNPFVNYTEDSKKMAKNNALRMIATFFELAASERYTHFLENRHPATEECLKYFNLKVIRSTLKCSFFLCSGSTKIFFAHDDVFSELGYENQDIVGYQLTEKLVPSDELEQFEENLNQAKKKLLHAVNRENGNTNAIRQHFEFTCRLRHKQTGRAITENRSTVVFSGSMRFCEGQIHGRFSKQGNGHIIIEEADSGAVSICLDKQIEIIGQIRLKPDDPFRQSIVSIKKEEYVLFMDPTGLIIWADHRIIGILGLHPQEVIHKFAHDFINPDDIRVALHAQKILLKCPSGKNQTILRLINRSGESVYLRNIGVLYNTNDKPIFKCTAQKIEKSHGPELIKAEHQSLPEDVRSCSIEMLRRNIKQSAIKFGDKSVGADNSNDSLIEQLKDAHLTSSSLSLSDSEFASSTENYSPPTLSTQSLAVRSSNSLINSLSHTYYQNDESGYVGQLNSVGNAQNLTQTAPIAVNNPLIYRYIPWTSAIATDQTTPNWYQIFNLPSPVPSTLNKDPVFIHNININIINTNTNNQQHLYGDNLPTEGAFVNLIPFLENDVATTDLTHTNTK